MKTPVDLIIEPRWIIPVEPEGIVLDNHAIAIDNGDIVALGLQNEIRVRYAARETRELPHHIVMPGLVNLHCHAAMTLLRGLADDIPLMDWLKNHIWPAESRHVSPQFVHDGTQLACAEMLRGGTTCFNDMYFFPKASARAISTSGMRAVLGLIAIDFPTNYAVDIDDYLDKGLRARESFHDNPLITACLAPHAPYTVSDRSFMQVLTLAEQCDLPIHLHLHETQQEIDDGVARYGKRPLRRLHELGLLSPGLIAAHGVHLDPDEIALLSAHGCSIAHCPSSNLKLASGIAPISALWDSGVNIGLGTDGAASNNRLDMFHEMRLAALLAKGVTGRAETITAHQAIRMATLNGARALGLDRRIGSIVEGKSADLCAIKANDIFLAPCYDPASLVVYSAGREHVSDVWVCGKSRVADGQLTANGEFELIKLAAMWQNQVCPRDI